MILQTVRILLTLQEWFLHASSQCVLGRVEKSKNGINCYGYCFLVAFWYVETGKIFFLLNELSAKKSHDWRGPHLTFQQKRHVTDAGPQMTFQQKRHLTDAGPKWTFSKKIMWLTRAPFDLSAKASRNWRGPHTSRDWRGPIWPFSKNVTWLKRFNKLVNRVG